MRRYFPLGGTLEGKYESGIFFDGILYFFWYTKLVSRERSLQSTSKRIKERHPWRLSKGMFRRQLTFLTIGFLLFRLLPVFGQGEEETRKDRLWVKEFFRHSALGTEQLDGLRQLARAHPECALAAADCLKNAKNAHSTNTLRDLMDALAGDYNWFECDVQLEGAFKKIPFVGNRRAICAHDPLQTNGLLFSEWAEIVGISGRGMKIDFKNTGAIDSVLATLKQFSIPDYRLIFNFSVGATIRVPGLRPTGSALGVFVKQSELFKIRQQFPGAVINLGLLTPGGKDGKSYSRKQIELLTRNAGKIGGKVMFPLRAEYVTRQIVEWLQSFGHVAIWNDPTSYRPANLEADHRKFRSWGVTGMIDLRP